MVVIEPGTDLNAEDAEVAEKGFWRSAFSALSAFQGFCFTWLWLRRANTHMPICRIRTESLSGGPCHFRPITPPRNS